MSKYNSKDTKHSNLERSPIPTEVGPEAFVNLQRVAFYLGIAPRTAKLWLKKGLPHYRHGQRIIRFRLSEVGAWFAGLKGGEL